MKLIIGLGNPGKEYEHTRHNVGWQAINRTATLASASEFKAQKNFKSEIAEGVISDKKILFVHPLTFMNASGEAVAALKNFYKCSLEDILVVQDEMDYAVGDMKFSPGNGDAGHNGIASIQEKLGTDQFARLRIGIGRSTTISKENYVLQPFHENEQPIINETLQKAGNAAFDWVILGTTMAMNLWNGNQN